MACVQYIGDKCTFKLAVRAQHECLYDAYTTVAMCVRYVVLLKMCKFDSHHRLVYRTTFYHH